MNGPHTTPTARSVGGRFSRGLIAVAVGAAIILQRHTLLVAAVRLGRASPVLIASAVALEVVSFAALAELQRQLLAGGGVRLRLRSVLALVWASNAIGALLPAGAAASAVYTYRQLTRRGAPAVIASWLLVSSAAVSSAALALLVVAGAQVRGLLSTCTAEDVLEVTALVGMLVAAVAMLAWTSARAARLERWQRRVHRARVAVRSLTHRPPPERAETIAFPAIELRHRQWAAVLSLATANWVADGAVLAVSMLAVGVHLPWRGLLFAYAMSQVGSSVPALPGSIGIAEGSLVVVLVCAGVAPGDAVAATLAYRIASFWLQMPPGLAAWACLRRTPAAGQDAPPAPSRRRDRVALEPLVSVGR